MVHVVDFLSIRASKIEDKNPLMNTSIAFRDGIKCMISYRPMKGKHCTGTFFSGDFKRIFQALHILLPYLQRYEDDYECSVPA